MTTKSKIVQQQFLFRKVSQVRTVSKKIGLCYGNFDIYHAGHADMFEKAKQACDMLVVIVNKNANNQYIYSHNERLYTIASNEHVDYVVLDTPEEIVELLKPDIVVTSHVGDEPPHTKMEGLLTTVKEYGGKHMSIPNTFEIKSSDIIKNICHKNIWGDR